MPGMKSKEDGDIALSRKLSKDQPTSVLSQFSLEELWTIWNGSAIASLIDSGVAAASRVAPAPKIPDINPNSITNNAPMYTERLPTATFDIPTDQSLSKESSEWSSSCSMQE